MKYKKILVITSRYPYPVRGGDKLRISEIIKFLSKKNSIDLISIGKNKKKISFINKQYLFNNNFFDQILNIINSFLKNEPLQVGLYKVPKMKKKIENIQKKYDVIIFHLIRTTYYLPKKFKGIKILEVTDLISKNYKTVQRNLSIFNPLKYLYNYERKKLNRYELKESHKFDRIVLVNKDDITNSTIKNNRNLSIIGNGTILKNNIFFNGKKKNNIIFFGNINSLANRSACIDFIKNYLPYLKNNLPNLKFKILGNCSNFLKIYFKLQGVEVISDIKELANYSKYTLAGICNVQIQSGLQNKVLDYASIGLPVLINKTSNNFKFLSNKDVLIFNNNHEFFVQLNKLVSNSEFGKKISKSSHMKIKKYYNWNNILKQYSKIIR